MRVKIDKNGRFVLPKAIRDRLGLSPGGQLVLLEVDDGILLEPVVDSGVARDEQGYLIVTAKTDTPVDWSRIVEKDREERILKIWRDATGDMEATLAHED